MSYAKVDEIIRRAVEELVGASAERMLAIHEQVLAGPGRRGARG